MHPSIAYPCYANSRRWLLSLVLSIGCIGSSLTSAYDLYAVQVVGGSSTRNAATVTGEAKNEPAAKQEKVVKTDQQWRQQLTEIEYDVTRRKGTERAYSGKYWNHKGVGIYTCKCCGQPLFDSRTKFKSGTGWPSFYQPLNPTAVRDVTDYSDGMVRTETVCSRCDAHLGHVFKDGPQPTGLRYCMNSVALNFKKAEPSKPQAQADSGKVQKTGSRK